MSYVNFLLPGIIVMTAVFGALTTGLGLTGDLAANAVTLVMMLLIGLAIGFRPTQPVYQIALALLLVLAFAYVFSWVSAFVGMSVRNPETAQSIGFIWVFPLVFASSAFVPTAHMPGVVHTFATVNPVTLEVNAVRALTTGHGHALTPALGTLAWLVGLLIVFVPLSVRGFRRL